MKKQKMIAILLVLAFMTTIVVACADQPPAATDAPAAAPAPADAPAAAPADAPAAAPADGTAAAPTAVGIHGSPDDTYYFLPFISEVEYWWPVYAGFKQAAASLGVQAHFVESPGFDAQVQLDAFEQILARNPTGILLCPIFPEIFVEPINRAIAQGVAITIFATDSPESNRLAFITSDNYFEAQFAARQLASEVGGVGQFMTLRNPGQLNHDIRVDEFIRTIEAEFPGIEIVADLPSNQDPDAAYTAVMTTAQQFPDLNGVFMPEAASGIGAGRASVELGGAIRILCVDVSEPVLDMIKAGQVWGAINPDQGTQGWWGMMLTFALANPQMFDFMNHRVGLGENPTFIPFMDNGLNIVTQENVDYYYMDAYLARLGYSSLAELLGPHIP